MEQVKGYHAMLNTMRNVKKIREQNEMDILTDTMITRYFDGKKDECLALSLVDTKGNKKNTYFAVKF